MNWFEKFVNALRGTMKIPAAYGLIHLISVILVAYLILVLAIGIAKLLDIRRENGEKKQ